MMTPDRKLLEAALEGFALQRKAIEAREAEIREAVWQGTSFAKPDFSVPVGEGLYGY